MRIHRGVWVVSEEGAPRWAGEVLVEDDGRCFFRYGPEFLRHGFPLDPVHLPLEQRVFRARELAVPLAIFDDPIPDAWGLSVLSKRVGFDFLRRRWMAVGFLDPSSVGGLVFSEPGEPPPQPTWIPFRALLDCFREVKDFELRKADLIFQYLGVSGTSAGGARPKASFVDEAGWPWLVKFPSVNDPTPETVARVEAEGLLFAGDLGVPIPEFKLIDLPGGGKALALRRFDVTKVAPPHHGRRVLISFATVLGGMHLVEKGYEHAGTVLRRISSRPREDALNFFRLALTNVCIVNTDDHLKNFSLLWNGQTLRLAPAYDLVGNLWGMSEHCFPINGKTDNFSVLDLEALGTKLGFSKRKIREETTVALERAQLYLERIRRIPGADSLQRVVEQRLNSIQSFAETEWRISYASRPSS